MIAFRLVLSQMFNDDIKVNDDIGHYFQTKKGLRQGDPMSPILFNIVADMLAVLIQRAKDDGQISGHNTSPG